MPESSKRSSSVDVLDNARSALTAASSLLPLIPVPLLSSVFMTAQAIITEAERVRTNKQSAIELARFTVDLVDDIARVLSGRQETPGEGLQESLKNLHADLEITRKIMQKHTDLSVYKRVVKRGSLAEELSECKSKLESSLRKFMMSSAINTQLQLQRVQRDVLEAREILQNERRYDSRNRYRIYREGEVDRIRLLGTIKRHTNIKFVGIEMPLEPEHGDIYEAEVEGRVRMVHYYRDPKLFKRTMHILDSLRHEKRIRFAQVEGCSPESSDAQFLILKGSASQLTPLIEHMYTLSLEKRFVESIRLMNSYMDVTEFLFRKGLRVEYNYSRGLFHINSQGEVIIGAFNEIVPIDGDESKTSSLMAEFHHREWTIPCHSILWEQCGFSMEVEKIEYLEHAYKSAHLPELYTALASGRSKVPLEQLLQQYFDYMRLARRSMSWTGHHIDAYLQQGLGGAFECDHGIHESDPQWWPDITKHFVKPVASNNDALLGLVHMFLHDDKHETFEPLYNFPSIDLHTCGLMWHTNSCHCEGVWTPLSGFVERKLREDAFPGAKLIKGVIVRHVKLETPPRYTISNKDLIIAIKTDFARYSLPLSGKRGIKLKDLAFAYSVSQKVSARVYQAPEGKTLYFHMRPRDDQGFLPEPWGYFSLDPEPCGAIEEAELYQIIGESLCDFHHMKFFYCKIPGVRAFVAQEECIDCWQTTDVESEILTMLRERCADYCEGEGREHVRLAEALRNTETCYKHDDPIQCLFIHWHSQIFQTYGKNMSCKKRRCQEETPTDLRNPGMVKFRFGGEDSESEDELP